MDVNTATADLHYSDLSLYKDAFMPPPPRLVKAWERAPVTARAPRLRGQKIWKKAGHQSQQNKENCDAAQLELDNEGKGARKKLRGTGAKQNIGDATWQEKASDEAETLDAPSLIVNGLRSPLKGKSLNTLACIPRKRTNADHIITPRKLLRNKSLDRVSGELTLQTLEAVKKFPELSSENVPLQAIALGPGVSPEMRVRKRKSLRRSTRKSLFYNDESIQPGSQGISQVNETILRSEVASVAPSETTQGAPTLGGPAMTLESLGQNDVEPCDEQPQQECEIDFCSKEADVLDESSEACQPSTSVFDGPASEQLTALNPACQPRGNEGLPEALANTPATETATPKSVRADIQGPTTQPQTSLAAPLEETEVLPSSRIIIEAPKAKTRGRSPRRGPRRSTRSHTSTRQSLQPPSNETPQLSARSTEITTSMQTVAAGEIAQGMLSDTPADAPFTPSRSEFLETAETTLETSRLEVEPLNSKVNDPVNPTPSEEDASEPKNEEFGLEMVESLKVSKACQEPIATRTTRKPEYDLADNKFGQPLSASDLPEAFIVPQGVNDIATEKLIAESTARSLPQEADISSSDGAKPAPVPPSLEPSSDLNVPRNLDNKPPESDDGVTLTSTRETQESAATLTGDSNNLRAEQYASPRQTTPEVNSRTVAPTTYDHDDTDMLRNFLTRVKAKKAAKAEEAQPKRKRSLPHSPLQLPLAEGDSLPSPTGEEMKDEFDVSLPCGSPRKRRRAGASQTVEGDATEPKSIRRSGRTRLPVKTALTAPSFIPIRRLGQDEDTTVTLKRSEEKELAALTRVNTRKNKTGAMSVAQFLAKMAEEFEKETEQKPLGLRLTVKQAFEIKASNKEKEQNGAKGKRRKSVVWAETLVEYQNADGKRADVEKEAIVEKEKEKVPEEKKKGDAVRVGVRTRVPGKSVNGTPAPKMRMRAAS